MELKHAVAICLIALVSATLVLLIARALDLQAASRLEPQLARIVEELEAIRKSGGIAPASSAAVESQPANDAVMVYHFHGNMRCPTCRAIESQAHETVQSDFASQLNSGEVIWKVLNYEEPAGTELGRKFEVQMPVVVVARTNGGEIEEWSRLDQVWALVGDRPAFAEFIRNEISRMLAPALGTSRIRTVSPSRSQTSWITTVSAPAGMGAPVKIRAAVPGSRASPATPAGMRWAIRRRGRSAARSALRTA